MRTPERPCLGRCPRAAPLCRVLAPLLVMWAGLPGTVAASSVDTVVSPINNYVRLTYTGAPGERNDVRISRARNGHVTIADPGATVVPRDVTNTDAGARGVPQSGCAPRGPHVVVCNKPARSSGEVRVLAGDLNDRVRLEAGAAIAVDASGGPGDDVLAGALGGDFLRGGAGDDVLVGGGGRDSLYGDEGADRLSGGAGGDALTPGAGFDLASCGTGGDVVGNPGSGDLVERDCERVARYLVGDGEGSGDASASWRPYPLAVRRGRAVIEVACLWNEDIGTHPCGGSISIRTAGRRSALLGRARFPVRKRAVRRVAVPLTPSGRRLAGRRGGVLAVVSVTGRNTASTGWRIRFRASR